MTKLSYKNAGVDIQEGNRLVSLIKPMVKSTFRPEVMGGIGGFSSMVSIPEGIKNPVLVSGTDGVGTKLKFAFMSQRFNTVGIDLVAMCVNDIAVVGADPLFFLDYFATGKLEADDASEVVSGIAEGCRQAGCALVGGETAEMPDFYADGEFDLAGFSVGVVDREKAIDGSKIKEGDILIGLPSSGVHSNGYSLVRKIVFNHMKLNPHDTITDLGKTVVDEFLTPTIIYVPAVKKIMQKATIKGMVHVTGGGFYENIPRVVPKGLAVEITGDFEVLPVFKWLQKSAELEEREMFTTFNCGIGYIMVVDPKDVDTVLAEEKGYVLGSVIKREDEEVIIRKSYFK